MKISASVYSNKERQLEELVRELDRYHVDFIHIDCNDDLNVFNDIRRIRKISNTPIDLHIISPEPEEFYEGIADTGAELVSFQFENLKEKIKIPSHIYSKLGLAIVSDTPVEVFETYKKTFDFILFMTTSPGKSGGTFDKTNFSKIRKFKSLFPTAKIHVDGGVNDEISFALRNMGASLVVSGSYLVNAEFMGAALHNLRSDHIRSHIRVSDFMTDREELPVLTAGNHTFLEALQSIEDYKMAFTMIVDDDNKLIGLISNADVRKGLIRNINNLGAINTEDLINRHPVTVRQDNTVSEMLALIKSQSIPILYLPVVDENNRLKGAIAFNNLIKGEF